MSESNIKKQKYFVSGMHCPSCEVLIERTIIDLPQIDYVDASTPNQEVDIGYEGQAPSIKELNKMFTSSGYTFSLEKPPAESGWTISSLALAAGVVVLFLLVNWLLPQKDFVVNSSSTLSGFFIFGLLAGVSSCAALVGGIILSLAKQWNDLYPQQSSLGKKLTPHLLFNIGRLASYFVLGAALGAIGAKLQFSPSVTSVLVIVISIIMVALGLQMLGVKAFSRFRIAMPKFIATKALGKENFGGKHFPFVLGALTFFLPCGFTLTAQGVALLSGSAWSGGLVMFFFALGTFLPLMLIGTLSVKFFAKPNTAKTFLKVAGVMVLFFALFNIKNQLNVLGFTGVSLPSTSSSVKTEQKYDFPPVVDGVQVVKIKASASGYDPNYIAVRAGLPVRLEVEDVGTSGCTNAIISPKLFSGPINLTLGQVSTKQFTPPGPGSYRFSCWMGMISGTILVVAN